jgi:hypothetical protein
MLKGIHPLLRADLRHAINILPVKGVVNAPAA